MTAPLHLERLKDGTTRKLRSYRVQQIGCRWVVVRTYESADQLERVFQTADDAEEYLFGLLPAIESEL